MMMILPKEDHGLPLSKVSVNLFDEKKVEPFSYGAFQVPPLQCGIKTVLKTFLGLSGGKNSLLL